MKLQMNVSVSNMSGNGLSEFWLIKMLGDIHWKKISDGLNIESSKVVDDRGNRLYSSFLSLNIDSSESFWCIKENESIEIETDICRFGRNIYVSRSKVTAQNAVINVDLASTFVYREAESNRGLTKSTPKNCDRHTCVLQHPPEIVLDFRKRLSLISKQSSDNRKREKYVVKQSYSIDSTTDLNTFGLLYFASYPLISDKCELSIIESSTKNEQLNWFFSAAIKKRKVSYFGNCDYDERLIYSLETVEVDVASDLICLTSSLRRASDNALISIIESEKIVNNTNNLNMVFDLIQDISENEQ